jgi:ClpP class serine protease
MANHARLLTRLINVPLLMDSCKFEVITKQVTLKLLSDSPLDSDVASPTKKSLPNTSSKVRIIDIFDSLVSKGGAGESGYTSYSSIRAEIQSAISDKVSKIGFYIDSPGGEAFGNFPLCELIASLPNKFGIKTFAITDGMMTSGAYSIAASCQKVYVTEVSNVGSIGAVMSLIDVTEMDKKDGISYTILRSKEDKALYNPHETISDAVKADAFSKLTMIDSGFNSLISRVRPNLSIEKIKEFKGGSFSGKDAVEKGLADVIVANIDECLAIELSNLNKKGNINMNEETLAALNMQLAEQNVKIRDLSQTVATAEKTATAAERERVLKIIDAGMEFKASVEDITSSISKGRSIEDARDIMSSIAARVDASTNISIFGKSHVPKVSASLSKPSQDAYVALMVAAVSGEDISQYVGVQ